MRTRYRFALVMTGLLALSGLLGAPPVVSGGGIVADLDGRAINPRQVGAYFCHDFDYPRIRCFETDAELEAAVAAYGADQEAGAEAVTGITYVRVYVDGGFAGSSAYLSQNYPDLGVIGWQDKISSIKGQNSQRGRFFEHNLYAGFVYSFCCNSAVSYVGDTYNDKFSSVKNTTP